jgi:hypothetical protein
LIRRIISGEQYGSCSCSWCNLLHPHPRYVFPLRPKYFAQHPILQHPQPMFSTTDQILNPKTDKIIALYYFNLLALE